MRTDARFISPVAQAASGAAGASDPYFSSVILLTANNNGANGSTTFIDQSSAGRTVTTNGNAAWSTAQFPAGMTSSLALDGSGDFLSLADAAAWDFVNSGDFSIEFPIRMSSTNNVFMIGQSNGGGPVAKWLLAHNWVALNAGHFVMVISPPDLTQIDFGAWSPSTNTWYDMGIFRSGNNWMAFANGVQIGSTVSSADRPGTSTGALKLATDGEQQGYVNGYMGPIRITAGVARQTGAYTPPTYPFPTS